eukprot:CAMPEP_0168317392 /NCGR_PEP_ID=MMETSP0210-20121227/24824_1 /TAXON_ID=40633 /ORGANISM="Condylostoma magnum, Strain COL2" /LENGTH=35 /DNA_ID= /DNA_START= /DNA_END= /DNA_ORIENTATION=
MATGTVLEKGTELKMPSIVSDIHPVPELDYLIASD